MSGSQETRPNAGSRGNVLVIEDIAADRAMLEGILISKGFTARVHDRPDLDPAQWAASPPRLIVLSADVKNGFNLCLRFKKDVVMRRVPLILVTAKASPDVIRKHRLLPTRADAYLTKPLTERALVKLLEELLPAASDPVVHGDDEVTIAEVPDTTLVSNGSLESAVVTYVEEEVRSLKTAVERLITEKSSLGGKVVDLETQLRTQQEVLDSGLERLGPWREENSSPSALRKVETSVPDLEERFEVARKEGYAAGLEDGRAEKRNRGLEQGRREGRAAATAELQAEREELEAKIAGLEQRAKELDERVADLTGREAGCRTELDQMTELFGRLEGGYKDALAKAEGERSSVQETVVRLEAERDELAARLEAIESSRQNQPSVLAERDARIVALEAEAAQYLKRLEASVAAGARVGELEAELAELRREAADATGQLEAAQEALADLEPLRQAEAALRAENERLNTRLRRVRDALELAEESS